MNGFPEGASSVNTFILTPGDPLQTPELQHNNKCVLFLVLRLGGDRRPPLHRAGPVGLFSSVLTFLVCLPISLVWLSYALQLTIPTGSSPSS